jgi:type IV fimbrial biogenesis protein FimT
MKKHTGFTMIELLIAMAILSISLAVGVPKLSIFFKGNRMITNTNDLLAGLNIARSEAIKVGARVTICKSDNAGQAAPTCTEDGGWESGWFVFVDSDNTKGSYNSASDGAILRINAGASGSEVTITVDASDNIENFASFTSRGVPKASNGASQSGVFRVCDDRGLTNASGNVVARGIVLGASGRARTTRDAAKIGACP